MVDALIGAGARLTAPGAVALGQFDELGELLKQDPDGLKPGGRWANLIYMAARSASGELVQALIDHGADVNMGFPDHHDTTALHAAAIGGNRSAAEVLLRNGVDVTVRDKAHNATAIGWADFSGHDELADWLKGQGVEP